MLVHFLSLCYIIIIICAIFLYKYSFWCEKSEFYVKYFFESFGGVLA